MILAGELALWVALLMAAWSVITSFVGGRTSRADLMLSGERGVKATWVLAVAATAGLTTALWTHDVSLAYVAGHTSANLPAIYLLSAFWAGDAGILLLCALLLSCCSVLVLFPNRNRRRAVTPYVAGALATVLLFLVAAMCFGANPYQRLEWIPPEGSGLHPRLQHPLAVLHAPLLYFGYMASAIPFAFGVDAVIRRTVDEQFATVVHRWSGIAWLSLTIAIAIGVRLEYVQPEWNAQWASHAVRNLSVLPWLATTLLLGMTAVYLRRGIVSRWSVMLAIATFLFALLALVTGVRKVSLVALPEQSVNYWPAGVIALAILASAFLAASRLKNRIIKAEARPGRARYAAYLVGAGLVMTLTGFAGASFAERHDVRLKSGETVTQRDPFGRTWSFTSQGVSHFQTLNRRVTATALQAVRDGQRVGLVTTEKRLHLDSRGVAAFEPSSIAGVRSSLLQDVQVVIADEGEEETAVLRIYFHPLVSWIWIGAAILVLGGLIMLWPSSEQRT